MRRISTTTAIALAGIVISGCSGDPGAAEATTTDEALGGVGHVAVCPPGPPGTMHCHAHQVVDGAGAPVVTSAPSGLTPADLQSAYGLPSSTAGAGKTIALVDAYDYPNAESDLATYRAQFGLPPCTTANGCFKKVSQSGVAGSYPRADSGWSLEMALDLDMASAVCPNCKILLVEANSASTSDLGAAVDTAVRLGATAVSNSYGGSESSSVASAEVHYNHAGVSITASSGDNGYGVEYPASSAYVTAVGGTSLKKAATTRGWSETAWSGSGSGCSAYIAKPSWQKDTGCAKRTVADVAAVADPNTGVAVYETFRRRGGWTVVGGTSAASPIVAGVFALAGNGAGPSSPYAHVSSLYDVTSGSNGSCGGSYLCTAEAGYDGPTGLGTPHGSGAF